MNDIIIIIFSRPDVMLFMGIFAHLLKNYDTWRITVCKTNCTIRKYWSENKVQHITSGIAAIAAYVGLAETNQLTALSAFGIGWMCNSVADYIGKKIPDKI